MRKKTKPEPSDTATKCFEFMFLHGETNYRLRRDSSKYLRISVRNHFNHSTTIGIIELLEKGTRPIGTPFGIETVHSPRLRKRYKFPKQKPSHRSDRTNHEFSRDLRRIDLMLHGGFGASSRLQALSDFEEFSQHRRLFG